MCQALNHFGPPALISLPGQNVATDLPIKQHQFPVYRQSGALLGDMDAAFQIDQPLAIAFRRCGQASGGVAHGLTSSWRIRGSYSQLCTVAAK